MYYGTMITFAEDVEISLKILEVKLELERYRNAFEKPTVILKPRGERVSSVVRSHLLVIWEQLKSLWDRYIVSTQ